MNRPEFAHASFGIEFYSLDAGRAVYAVNEKRLFVPGSTTKLLTEGALLASLGPDYRFHTHVYGTGPVDPKGRLHGDLVLVAIGDPNLSSRIQPDGALGFGNPDHSYGGPAILGDPFTVFNQFAKDIAAKGVIEIDGRILVDASLFSDVSRPGEGLGTGVVISSITVNDNIIDLTLRAGAHLGDTAELSVSTPTSYAQFIDHMTTAAAGTPLELDPPRVVTNPDGTIVVTMNGAVPLGAPPTPIPFFVPSPTVFAERVLRDSLIANGIKIVGISDGEARPDFHGYTRFYIPTNQLAEHVSPPLREEIKVTLKVSQNLHAFMGPYLMGTIVAKNTQDPLQAGFDVERAFLKNAALDLSGASQGDGAGGDWADLFSPDFLCKYLAYWASRVDYSIFLKALPILGKDGTLADFVRDSPAAGHVMAKTGTFGSWDRLNDNQMLNGKSLAGYIFTKTGQRLTFAVFVNHVHIPKGEKAADQVAGEAMAQIAAAAYDAFSTSFEKGAK
jgi:D-alanyl-D-alanine carboxypeptidase/D-alanyl-D-alanine-endopeptidase (penicillin-binding protein 4)